MGAFGFECPLDRVIEELKSDNDFSIHRIIILDPVNVSFYFVMYSKIWWTIFYIIAHFFLLNGCKWNSMLPVYVVTASAFDFMIYL
jgi:hypothetical protein